VACVVGSETVPVDEVLRKDVEVASRVLHVLDRLRDFDERDELAPLVRQLYGDEQQLDLVNMPEGGLEVSVALPFSAELGVALPSSARVRVWLGRVRVGLPVGYHSGMLSPWLPSTFVRSTTP
jgi:hypothetical protein